MENNRAEKKTCTEKLYKTHYRHVEKKLHNMQVIYTHFTYTRIQNNEEVHGSASI